MGYSSRMAGADPTLFALSNVTKSFGAAPVLRGLDLQIPAGRTTVLIGPSGCGKSTLIRLMLGLIEPEAGTIQFQDHNITPATAPALRRRMGYVIQGGGLFPHLTARGNVTLMARHLGWPESRISDRVDTLATLTHYPDDRIDAYPAQLSGGQRQRVALMRALMLDPDVLFLDEPLGALDPMVRFRLQTDLRDIFQSLGKTVILVTHDIGEAGFFGDRLVLIRDGAIVQTGAIEDLVKRPATPFVAEFVNAQRTLADTLADLAP